MPEGTSDQIRHRRASPKVTDFADPLSHLQMQTSLRLRQQCDLSSLGGSTMFARPERQRARDHQETGAACRKADQWAEHASVFDPKEIYTRTFLTHQGNLLTNTHATVFTRAREEVAASRTAEHCDHLGYWLDPDLELTSHHRKEAATKANISLQALKSLAGSTWGASLYAMRRIYQAVIIPQIRINPCSLGKLKARTISRPS